MTERKENQVDWPAWVERLEVWWNDHTITIEAIAERIGTTRLAIIGKAHRLALPTRPNKVNERRGGCASIKQQYRIRKRSLQAVIAAEAGQRRAKVEKASAAAPRVRAPAPARASARPAVDVAPRPAPAPPPAPAAPVVSVCMRRDPVSTCCWPIGEPGRSSFRFCDAPAVGRRPYCDAHACLAYVRAPAAPAVAVELAAAV